MENMEEIMTMVQGLVVDYGLKLIYAVVTLVIGLWIIGMITRGFSKTLEKREVDPSLIPFLRSVINIMLKVALVVTVATMMGIEMTSFVAILGAAGLAVGLALQGTLQNFAGGVMILLFKPYKVGDVITAGGHTGGVKEIQIFNTILTTPDNKIIILPNGSLANSSMVNFSTMPTRRVDFSFGIGYNDDFEKAKSILHDIIAADSRIHKDPEPFVRVGELADSSVNITVRVWADSADYWGIHFDMIEAVKKRFDAEGISIPYPQMDVHVDQMK